MVDTSLIQRKLTLLEQKKKELNSYDIRSLEDFQSKSYMQKAVEKLLQETIEICLDVAKHIISDEGFRLPEDMKDSFTVLTENKVIQLSTAEMLKKMVGFRNLIIHLYEKIDNEIVYGIYRNKLDDFDCFTKEILDFLKKVK